jgi:hypothetical protein
MTNSPSQRFEVLRGVVADLTVSSGEEEFVQTRANKAVGAGLGASLVLSGLAGSATAAMLATSGSADSVQFFTCTVEGKRVAGRFSSVWFANGDAVEIAGEPQRDGSFAAYAVRRARDRTLWMFPHCSRGRLAHWRTVTKWLPLPVAASFGFFFGMELLRSQVPTYDSFLWAMAAANAIVGTLLLVKQGWKWRPFVAIAEQVFAALGYANPSHVDMERQDSLYWKKHAQPGEHRRVAPWVFRYVDKA